MDEQDVIQEERVETEVQETEVETQEIHDEEVKETRKERKEKKKFDKERDELIKANLELKEKILRITAEMQNMKRRYDLDLANAYKYDGYDLAEKLLPIIDNFERAMNVKQEGMEKFLEGFKMVYQNLQDILKSKGIIEIDAVDKMFDPSIMNAVLTDTNNEKENNIVLDVLQKGYMYNDKLLRPAMVKVNERESE